MNGLFAFGVSIFFLAALPAQVRLGSPSRPPLVSSGASSRPLGGVALPTFPARPLGAKTRKAAPATGAYRYFGPVYYIPNAYDYDYGYDYSPDAPPPPPEQPVRRRQRLEPERAETLVDSGGVTTSDEPVAPPPENYYLIAYKNHTVYPALSYWIDGETLHYVTTDNTHNQASMAFIDLDRTTKLNADRAVPFTR